MSLATEAPARLRRIALAGNPNVGKTTVFNLLTGLRQKVGNYPGVTVERKSGRLAGAVPAEVVDLPGTYSLNPRSQDEQIAHDMLAGRLEGETPPDLVVCVTDATNLERNLFLVSQIMDLGLPTVVVLNMMDAAQAQGLQVNTMQLSRALGVPVVPMVATRKIGLEALRRVLAGPPPVPPPRRWTLPPAVEERVAALSEALTPHLDTPQARFSEALRTLVSDTELERWGTLDPAYHQAVCDARAALKAAGVPCEQAEIEGRYDWLGAIVGQAVARLKDPADRTLSDRLDAVLTHPVLGPGLFFMVLMLIFQAVFSWATPAMDLIAGGMGLLGGAARQVLPAGMLTDLLVDGAIAGVGNVLVFLPQILLLFFFLGLMEDTGYMARTSLIMDRVMSRIGLSGGSVVPLLSSFACAIPGIMATRTIQNQRDRLLTIMVAPLMSCSARLPVYTLFIAAFIPAGHFLGFISIQGLTLVILYLMGMVMAFVAAWVLKKHLFKSASSFFAIELPPYRMPQARQLFLRMGMRSRMFVTRAGKIIFSMSIVLWFLASFPKSPPDPALEAEQARIEARYRAVVDSLAAAAGMPALRAGDAVAVALQDVPDRVAVVLHRAGEARAEAQRALDNLEAGRQIRNSIVGRIGRFIEPVMQPLGFDWKVSAGLISAFAAREVIISTLGTLYSVGDADETSTLLRDQLKADRYPDGRPVFTPLVAVSLLVFFVFALQCMSTLAVARRETNSWRWPAVMWLYMTGLAYLCSLLVYQGGLALGFV